MTPRELYQLCVGAGGMSPDYYMHKLTHWEAQDYIEGVARRSRPLWETARLIVDVVARVAGNKNGVGLEFPWESEDREERQAAPSESDYEELMRMKERMGWE